MRHPDPLDVIESLFVYETWCNARLADALCALPDDDLHRDHGFGLRTLHRTLAHVLTVLRGWGACVGPDIDGPDWRTGDDDADVATLRLRLADEGDTVLAALRVSRAAGVLCDDRRLNQVLHLVTHGTHHRAQALSMLTRLGHPQPYEGGDFGGWSNPRR